MLDDCSSFCFDHDVFVDHDVCVDHDVWVAHDACVDHDAWVVGSHDPGVEGGLGVVVSPSFEVFSYPLKKCHVKGRKIIFRAWDFQIVLSNCMPLLRTVHHGWQRMSEKKVKDEKDAIAWGKMPFFHTLTSHWIQPIILDVSWSNNHIGYLLSFCFPIRLRKVFKVLLGLGYNLHLMGENV